MCRLRTLARTNYGDDASNFSSSFALPGAHGFGPCLRSLRRRLVMRSIQVPLIAENGAGAAVAALGDMMREAGNDEAGETSEMTAWAKSDVN